MSSRNMIQKMDRYLQAASNIPWASPGRETTTFNVGRSLLAVGVLPFKPQKIDEQHPPIFIDNRHPDFEKFLMNILGTAIQAGDGKLVTCAHVLEATNEEKKPGYVLARHYKNNTVIYTKYPIIKGLRYIDPRSKQVNKDVDLVVIPLPAKSIKEMPYDVPVVRWGDSTKLGVGDNIIIGGYPYGTDLFLVNSSNRGVIQPSFFPGIVSAIVPAQNNREIRLLQLSAAVAGGISGGAVLIPSTGEVVGMVTSGLTGQAGELHPVTYAIPSEVIMPFVGSINYASEERHWGKTDPYWFDEYE